MEHAGIILCHASSLREKNTLHNKGLYYFCLSLICVSLFFGDITLRKDVFVVDAFVCKFPYSNNIKITSLRNTPSGRHLQTNQDLTSGQNSTAVECDDVTASRGFWKQQPSILKKALASPPPDHILLAIQSQPYRGGFEPASDFKHPFSPKIAYGAIPRDLVGTLAFNCPGRIRIGGRMLGHWFDGDGYLVTLSVDGRNNTSRIFGKYVRTARFRAQEENGKSISDDHNYEPPLEFSGAWTKGGTGKWYENFGRVPENPSNTATMWLTPDESIPRLFALCEGGHPIEVDPITLHVVREERPFHSPPDASHVDFVKSFFSAHPSRDPITSHIYNHGYVLDPNPFTPPVINLMELSPDGHLIQQRKSLMPYNTFVHDATISQNFYLYFVNPYVVPSGPELAPFVLGNEPLGGLFSWKGEPSGQTKSYLHVHSKKDLSLTWSIEVPDPMSVFHIVDAFEDKNLEMDIENNTICLKIRVAELHSTNPVADRTRLEEQFANQYAVPSGERLHARLKEYTFLLHNNSSGSGRLLGSKEIVPTACEYPITKTVGGSTRINYTWINAIDPGPTGSTGSSEAQSTNRKLSDWFDGVQKVHMENEKLSSRIVSFGENTYCSPPYFVSKDSLSTPKRDRQDAGKDFKEDEGYLIVVLYKSEKHQSDIAILDSSTMDVLCILELDVHIPYSFHGEFLSDFIIPM